MLTLHSTTEMTKNIFKWMGILVVSVGAIYFLVKGVFYLKEKFYPTPAPAPTVLYGKLPAIPFPSGISEKSFTYSINTLSGTYPSFPDRTKVYKTIPYIPTLKGLQQAREKIRSLDFKGKDGNNITETALSNILYKWTDQSTSLERTLTMDIVTSDWTLTSDYLSSPDTVADPSLGNSQDSINSVKNFFSKIVGYPDITDEKTTTELFRIENNALIPASGLKEAMVSRVDFFQSDLDNLPVYYPFPPYSTMHASLISRNELFIVDGEFFHQNIDATSFGTYPIKTAEEAFEELKSGRASIRSYSGNQTDIKINDIFLGYYVGKEKQEYVMPIIIFQADDNFFAYVSAIKDDWLEK